MSLIQDEMLRLFPEASECVQLDGSDGDYVAAAELADWIASGGVDPQVPDQVARLREFANWCCSQPEGETADDDIGTIYMVGFFETLLESPGAASLIPLLVDRAYYVASADYFKRWVGEKEYANVLKSGWR